MSTKVSISFLLQPAPNMSRIPREQDLYVVDGFDLLHVAYSKHFERTERQNEECDSCPVHAFP